MGDTRVCFVSLHSYGYFADECKLTGGGAERQISLLAVALAGSFDVHVVVADYGQAAREVRDGVTLHRAYDQREDPTAAERLHWLGRLVGVMSRIDADLYVHRGTPAFAAVVSTVAALLGKPWVYNVANDANIEKRPAELGRVRRYLFERGLERAAVIAQTPKQAQMLRDSYGIEAAVVPNGYPPANGVVPYDGRKYVLWVGTLDREQKRPHLLLDLAEALPDVAFRLIGPPGDDDAYHHRLERRIDRLENVTYLGQVPPDAIHDHYRCAVVFVSTSRYEGFPNTFLEAWRVGTPVVSLDVDPNRFTGRGTGRSFARGDQERLVAIVRDVAADVTERRRLGQSGRRAFERQFAIDAVAEQYGDVLRRHAQ